VGDSGVYGAEVDCGLNPARWRFAYRADKTTDARIAPRHTANTYLHNQPSTPKVPHYHQIITNDRT
ncbi:hypothetical protein ACVGWR_18485, partial [Enterobacter hormaechei]